MAALTVETDTEIYIWMNGFLLLKHWKNTLNWCLFDEYINYRYQDELEKLKDYLLDKEVLEIYDLVFEDIHSRGFKISEVRDLLFDEGYWFLQKPKLNWKEDLIHYLDIINYDTSLLKMRKEFGIN